MHAFINIMHHLHMHHLLLSLSYNTPLHGSGKQRVSSRFWYVNRRDAKRNEVYTLERGAATICGERAEVQLSSRARLMHKLTRGQPTAERRDVTDSVR